MNTISHVAIIMDGNGRWAKKINKSRSYGHKKGAENIDQIVQSCINQKIKYLSLFALGFDNLKRPKSEIKFLFSLFKNFFEKNLDFFLKKNIKIKFIGEINLLPIDIKKIIKKTENYSKKKNNLNLIIAINYSSKHELLNAAKKTFKNNKKNIFSIKNFEKNLYTSGIPDPEILIRTGGYKRLSNFLLWQNSYSEIFFIEKFWPDFNRKDFLSILSKFKSIKRNFGNI